MGTGIKKNPHEPQIQYEQETTNLEPKTKEPGTVNPTGILQFLASCG